MWTLSGFADEISPDLDTQLDVVAELGMSYVEFRSAWGTNVLDLSDSDRARALRSLDQRGIRVSSIGSPIGKIGIDEDFGPHLERMRHAAAVAGEWQAPFVRIFSFWMPKGEDPARHRDEVMRRMDALAQVGAEAGVMLVHENEKHIYGDVPQRCHDIVTTVDNPSLTLAWDAANYVQCGVRPFTDGYALLRPHTTYIQIKDAKLDDGTVVPSGEGDGESRETVAALRDDGFDGFFSLEPHLAAVGSMGGFSGPELFRTAHTAFTGLLREAGVEYA
jgi:sugar phosphate isomerase/epimerase